MLKCCDVTIPHIIIHVIIHWCNNTSHHYTYYYTLTCVIFWYRNIASTHKKLFPIQSILPNQTRRSQNTEVEDLHNVHVLYFILFSDPHKSKIFEVQAILVVPNDSTYVLTVSQFLTILFPLKRKIWWWQWCKFLARIKSIYPTLYRVAQNERNTYDH